jgi:hypothetical protein
MHRSLRAALLFVLPVLGGCGHYEMPDYQVTQQDDDFEIRTYAPQLIAEVTVQGTRQEAARAGFRQLAAYIFGGNQPQASLAMTAPVTQQSASTSIAMTAPVTQQQTAPNPAETGTAPQWQVRFMMPKTYQLATLPKPNDPAVSFRTLPAYRAVVVRFSGWVDQEQLAAEEKRLRDYVAAKGLTPEISPPTYAFYDPPWTLPFWRRNEIALTLAPSSKP